MNTKVTQITLSVLAALALSACGSSGGSSSSPISTAAPTTGATSGTTAGTGTGGATAGTGTGGATAGTGTGGATAGTGTGSATAGTGTGSATAGTGTGSATAGTGTGNNTAATAAETNNHQTLRAAPSTASSNSFVGFKTIVKEKSNLTTNSTETIGEVSSKADTPEGMQVQNPFPSFDTIVVGEERDADGKPVPEGKVVYLEDFDFRGNPGGTAATTGKFTLNNLYINSPTKAGSGATRVGDPTDPAINITREKEIKEKGAASGEALVFQDKRKNYTHDFNTNKYDVVDTTGTTVSGTIAETRARKDTVAEVYGYRTNASAGEYNQRDNFTSDGQANAPFQYDSSAAKVAAATTPAADKELKNVQYGRVTSALHGQQLADLKKGLNLGTNETLVGDFGKQGAEKTEDHYFYRGVNNITEKTLADLKKVTNNGTLTYNGHAVTYGIDNNWHGNQIAIPTAVGGTIGLVSGTHVTAKVNLANGDVDGKLFNQWHSSAETKNNGLVDVDLVKFNGKLADNGNIAGTSTYLKDGSTGLLGATLYGHDLKDMTKPTELGGTVASDKKGDNQWGAVFGATETERVKTPTPTKPQGPDPVSQIGGSNNKRN